LGAKDLALLTFLVLEPGVHTREVGWLLWGEPSIISRFCRKRK
jgi:hypothetical protein